MVDNSPVRGCMVIKPWGMAIWDRLKTHVDAEIANTGATNAYFPLFIPASFLAKEAAHVAGFAQECAVVTHRRLCSKEINGVVEMVPDESAKLDVRQTVIGRLLTYTVTYEIDECIILL
jgi:prolyl-tRNA synthetase